MEGSMVMGVPQVRWMVYSGKSTSKIRPERLWWRAMMIHGMATVVGLLVSLETLQSLFPSGNGLYPRVGGRRGLSHLPPNLCPGRQVFGSVLWPESFQK